MSNSDSIVVSTAVALGIGLLIGTERERSKGSGPDREIAGVRTFALVSLLGLVATFIDAAFVLPTIAVVVGALAIAGYVRARTADPGITTEIAMLVVFGLGALSANHPTYSAGVAVIVTVLLASRPWLHDVVKRRISNDELWDGFTLAAAALVVLPHLPDRTIDPWDVFNPHKIWVVIVVVMTVNALGYIGLHVWGPTKGLMLAGLLGGLVSSAATHAAMAQRSRSTPANTFSAASAATFSSVITALFLLAVVATVDDAVARPLILPCLAAAAVGVIYALFLLSKASADDGEFKLGRAINLHAALVFGITLSSVLMAATILSRWLGTTAALTTATIAGFADTHSSAISSAMLAQRGIFSPAQAEFAILLAFSANSVTKVLLSIAAGTKRFALLVAGGLLCSTATIWIVWQVAKLV